MQSEDKQRRIIGEFVKQVWTGPKNDRALTVATLKFDATRAVLSRDLGFIHRIRDNDYGSDEIGRECVKWDGPFEVSITESIVNHFGLGDEDVPDLMIEQVTQEMLDEARTAYGDLDPDTLILEFKLKVTYSLNGESPDDMRSYLEKMGANAIGNGMLTGSSATEVDEYIMEITTLPVETVIEETAHEV